MAKSDFSSYLTQSVDEIPTSLPSLPLGHYFATLKDWKTDERFYDKSNPKKGTPVVELTFSVQAPDDDVEESDLPAGGVKGRQVRKDYTLNDPDSRGQMGLRRVCEIACGINGKGLQLQDLLDAAKGSDVKVYNEPRVSKTDDSQFFDNITRVVAAS